MKEYQYKAKARDYFGITGNYNMVLHHIDETMKYTNSERYKEWRIEDLRVMTRAEHASYHHTGKVVSEETKQKMRKPKSEETKQKMRKPKSEETRKKMSESAKGKKMSEESKQKMSEKKKGKHWYLVDGKRVWSDYDKKTEIYM